MFLNKNIFFIFKKLFLISTYQNNLKTLKKLILNKKQNFKFYPTTVRGLSKTRLLEEREDDTWFGGFVIFKYKSNLLIY